MKLIATDLLLAVHRFPKKTPIPDSILKSAFYSITRTDEELSIVCPDSIDVKAEKSERDWKCLKAAGPLDFGLTGVLSSLTAPLAEKKIPVFAISTFDTDYLLVKKSRFDDAVEALRTAGVSIA